MPKLLSDNPIERGRRIRNLRKEAKLTLEQVAEFMAVSKATLSRYENGEIERIRNLDQMAKKLNTTSEYILYGTGDVHPRINQNLSALLPGDTDLLYSPAFVYESNQFQQSSLSHHVGFTNGTQFVIIVEDNAMAERIRIGDRLFITACDTLTPDRVNVYLSADDKICIRDVTTQDGFFLLKTRSAGALMVVTPENFDRQIKRVYGYCTGLQTSEI